MRKYNLHSERKQITTIYFSLNQKNISVSLYLEIKSPHLIKIKKMIFYIFKGYLPQDTFKTILSDIFLLSEMRINYILY